MKVVIKKGVILNNMQSPGIWRFRSSQ